MLAIQHTIDSEKSLPPLPPPWFDSPSSLREQRDLLWSVLNAVRCATRFNNTDDIKELLPRMDEVLHMCSKEPLT